MAGGVDADGRWRTGADPCMRAAESHLGCSHSARNTRLLDGGRAVRRAGACRRQGHRNLRRVQGPLSALWWRVAIGDGWSQRTRCAAVDHSDRRAGQADSEHPDSPRDPARTCVSACPHTAGCGTRGRAGIRSRSSTRSTKEHDHQRRHQRRRGGGGHGKHSGCACAHPAERVACRQGREHIGHVRLPVRQLALAVRTAARSPGRLGMGVGRTPPGLRRSRLAARAEAVSSPRLEAASRCHHLVTDTARNATRHQLAHEHVAPVTGRLGLA